MHVFIPFVNLFEVPVNCKYNLLFCLKRPVITVLMV